MKDDNYGIANPNKSSSALFMLQGEKGDYLCLQTATTFKRGTGTVWGSLDSLLDDVKAALTKGAEGHKRKLRGFLLTAIIRVYCLSSYRALSVPELLASKGLDIRDFL